MLCQSTNHLDPHCVSVVVLGRLDTANTGRAQAESKERPAAFRLLECRTPAHFDSNRTPETPRILTLVLTALALQLAPSPFSAAPAARPLGQFEDHGDVGAVKKAGDATYDARTDRYELSG